MPAPDLSEFAAFAARLADAARSETLPRFRAGAPVFNKSDRLFDPVTDADREAESVLRKLIKAAYPEHGVLGEEFGAFAPEAEWRWVLDPVDGTRAFISGVASWTTLIALEWRKTPALGVIDQPFTDERWTGFGGETLYSRAGRDRPCRASGVETLAEARISTTDPRGAGGYFTAEEAAAFLAVAEACRLARFSLDAYGYALVASGEIDLVIEAGLNHHDIAALIPVVEGAGGVITDWRGGPPGEDGRGRVLAAASPALHAAALEILSKV